MSAYEPDNPRLAPHPDPCLGPHPCRGFPVCRGCGKPVQRNRFILNGQAWHYGCAKAKGVASKATYYCPGCGRFFTYARIHRCTLDGEATLMCPNCHSIRLKHIRRSPGRGRWL